MAIAGGCADPSPRQGPADTVRSLHAAWLQGRTDDMASLYDYEGILARQLGEIWSGGRPADREAAVRQLHTMMLQTTKRLWSEHLAGRQLSTSVHKVDEGEAWVHTGAREEQPRPQEDSGFQWKYRVTRRDGVWRVAQREFSTLTHHSNSARFYPTVIKHLRGEYGRNPTLSELVANVPALAARMRVRTVRLPTASTLKTMRNKQNSEGAGKPQ